MIELVVTIVMLLILLSAGTVGVVAIMNKFDVKETKLDLETVRGAQVRFASTYGSFTPYGPDLSNDTVAPFTVTGLDVEVTPDFVRDRGVVSFAVGDAGSLGLAAFGPDETCYFLLVPAPNRAGSATSGKLADSQVCEGRAVLPPGERALPSNVSAK